MDASKLAPYLAEIRWKKPAAFARFRSARQPGA
jgi:hypothetical protein